MKIDLLAPASDISQRSVVIVRTVTKIPVFRFSGEYFGFIHNSSFFDATSNYLGWVEDGCVWLFDGTFLGRLVEDNYIIKPKSSARPARRSAPEVPDSPIPPFPEPNRICRTVPSGCLDALDCF